MQQPALEMSTVNIMVSYSVGTGSVGVTAMVLIPLVLMLSVL